MDKKFCTTHHLYYQGFECPMCLSERVSYYDHKYNGRNNDTPKKDGQKRHKDKVDREINEDDISMLINKFNNR